VAKRREQRSGAEVRLLGLYEAGDWRRARAEARSLAGAGSEVDRALAEDVLRRLRPEPGAVAAAAVGLLLLGVVAAVGLLAR
jgi:hypothetical protein